MYEARWVRRLVWLFATALMACGGDDDDVVADADGGDDDDAVADADGGDDDDFGGDDDDDDADGDADVLPEEACRHVDLVIAVDDSGSMDEEKEEMRSVVFPAFARELLGIGGGLEDFRVGVLDACPDPANYHTRGDDDECNFASGQVWMESSDPDLEAEFECVGNIYSDDVQCSGEDDDEQPLSAAATSLEAPWSTGPNAGFLREDALLVVVAITDEDEQPTGAATTAQQIHDRLGALKGDPRRLVVLGIAGSHACEGEYGGAEEADLVRAVVDSFAAEERGVFWDLCEGSLEDGLAEAMRVIEDACQDLPDIF